jgi:YHS domain-containing protein
MKCVKILSIILAIAFLMVGYVLAENEVKPKAQINCPIMGGKIDKKIYADHEGKRVYFCCKGCIPEFKKDPEKYIKELEGVTLEEAPKAGLNKESSHGTDEAGKQSKACGDCGCSS